MTPPAPSGSGFRLDEDYPKTLAERARRFGPEDAGAEYRARLRWPDGFTCPRCRATDPWRLGNGLWRCSSASG